MEDMRESLDGSGRVVLCAANSYEQKYFFNKTFQNLPTSIQEDLKVICVLFTEEVGGVFAIVFEEDGGVSFSTEVDDADYLYDDVASALLQGEIRRNRAELLESLSLYYRTMILKEDPSALLAEEE